MDLGLQQHVIAVTGGGSGIGQGITRACLAEGASVVIVGRVSQGVAEFMDEMRAEAQPCELFETELAEPEACKRAVEWIQNRYGRLDGLVNNAGFNDSVGLEEGDPATFLKSVQENLGHCYSMTHYALPMLKQGRGSIVNISSKVALTGQGGTSAYAATKAAQLGLTREWAVELLPYGIRVNAVLPAEVMTPLYRSWIDRRNDPEKALADITSRIPLGRRMTEAAEIAAMVVFLLSPTQSSHTTGQHVIVDGGYTHLDRAVT